MPVHLAAGLGRQGVHDGEQRNQRGGQAGGEQLPRGGEVRLPAVDRREVADQHLVAGRRRPHRRRGAGDVGQCLERGVDLAEFDPAAAEFDLFVGAADKEQALGFVADQVAGTVGPGPAQGRQRGVLFRVLGRVEVPGQPDAADDQFPGPALGDRHPVGVDDGEVPAVQRQPDPDRSRPAQRRGAGDDGGLGGPVGVPDFASVHGQPVGEFGRAGLAAENQQPDAFQRLDGPQRGERGHRGHHRDAVVDQPGAQVHAGPDQGAGRRDQARPVPPGEPHLLAGGIEGHREAGQYPVLGSHRLGLQEDPRLGVDERGSGTVPHRDAFGRAGGPGGEDDPGVVAGDRLPGALEGPGAAGIRDNRAAGAQDARHPGLAEDQFGPLVRVVRIDRNIGGPHKQHRQDRDVELVGARGDPDADLVPGTQPGQVQLPRGRADLLHQLGIAEGTVAVVERGGVREAAGGVLQDIDQRPLRRRRGGARQLRLVVGAARGSVAGGGVAAGGR